MVGRQKLRHFLRRTLPAITLLTAACWIVAIQFDVEYHGDQWWIELNGGGVSGGWNSERQYRGCFTVGIPPAKPWNTGWIVRTSHGSTVLDTRPEPDGDISDPWEYAPWWLLYGLYLPYFNDFAPYGGIAGVTYPFLICAGTWMSIRLHRSAGARRVKRWRPRPALKWIGLSSCIVVPALWLASSRATLERTSPSLQWCEFSGGILKVEWLELGGWHSGTWEFNWSANDFGFVLPEFSFFYDSGDVIVPMWLLFSVCVALTIRWWQRRAPAGCCGRCGYNLTGNESGACPECGTRITGAAVPAKVDEFKRVSKTGASA